MNNQTELWASVAGFEGLYEVSNLGQVRSLIATKKTPRGRILKPRIAGRGYLFVSLYKGGRCFERYVHRLVAAAFVAGDKSMAVNHMDFDKVNNAACNLEWVTSKENSRHRIAAAPGLSGAEAFARLEAEYIARANRPLLIKRHPKQKDCTVCGATFSPCATKRERAKTCSQECAQVQRWQTRRHIEGVQAKAAA